MSLLTVANLLIGKCIFSANCFRIDLLIFTAYANNLLMANYVDRRWTWCY